MSGLRASGNEVSQLLKSLSKKPEILWLTPRTLAEIDDNLRGLGRATGRIKEAEELITKGRERLGKIAAATRDLPIRPRVFCMEWLDPPYTAGHWVPEMVDIAGGRVSEHVRSLEDELIQARPDGELRVVVAVDEPGHHEVPPRAEDP